MQKINLNGKWNIKQIGGNIQTIANVPVCNYTALIENNIIKNPFVSTYEKDASFVGEYDWEFSRDFDVDSVLLEYKYINLQCKMLDTIATIFINDIEIANTKNCFIEYSFDIKKYIFAGRNHIKVVFKSPIEYVKEHQKIERVPRNNNGQNGIPHIRKPQCHFGWDWGPVLVPSGITKDIFITFTNVESIKNVDIRQYHHKDYVNLSVEVSSENCLEYNYRLEVFSPENKLIKSEVICDKKPMFSVRINSPKLWWIYELNKVDIQPLYRVEISIVEDGKILSKVVKKIGLRTIKLDRTRDKYGENFCFVINDVQIFVKGANWIPQDSFIDRVTTDKIDYYLNSARYSNFNMIRIWGGGYYGDDYFYNKCDEMGILLWQDFMFACQPYPFFIRDLLENVLDEVTFNVNRLKHHASLALWCGNNEIEVMDIAWRNRVKYIKWTEKFFYHILPQHLEKIDNVTPYIQGSPIGTSYQKGFCADNVGDTHLWAVWHGLQPLDYYRKRYTRFCSEYGFESLPDLKTIEQFATKEDYSLNSKVFNSHQKCLSGNKKMKYYIASRFSLPKNFVDYVYLSQICQLECIRDATEHWRRNKGRCNGSMYWQFNDCWPVCSWSSIDYYGNYKALQYGAKHFNNPISLSITNEEGKIVVYAINDTLYSQNYTLSNILCYFSGEMLRENNIEIILTPNSVSRFEVLDISGINDIKKCVFKTSLYQDNSVVFARTMLFDIEKRLNIPKANVDINVKIEGDKAVITLFSHIYAHYVAVYSMSNTTPFSDNYFDLMPNETKVITQQINGKDINVETEYQVKSLSDIVAKGSRIYDNLERFKIFIEPVNFVQYLYNMFVPKDIK